jgi:hypothetical protein
MKFKKDVLQDLAYDMAPDGYEVIETTIVEQGRWVVSYDQVFKYGGKYYSTYFDKGATECQDWQPYQECPEEIEVQEVGPVERTVTVYEPKEQS